MSTHPMNEQSHCPPRKQVKSEAQDALMHGMQAALSAMPRSFGDERDVHAEAIKQFRRVEKLFGYVPGSWGPSV
jgi:hypothetical protein